MFGVGKVTKSRLKSVPGWPFLDDVQMYELTPDHVRRLISAAFASGYSFQTVKHIRNVISAIVRHAEREKCFSGINPVTRLTLPPVRSKLERHLTVSQTKAILELMAYPEKSHGFRGKCSEGLILSSCPNSEIG
jgi:site-specific recombinase XerD